jgi:MYXO-CTERM domain-containing protein
MLIDPGVATDVGGLGLLAVALFLQWRKKRGLVTSELPTAAS